MATKGHKMTIKRHKPTRKRNKKDYKKAWSDYKDTQKNFLLLCVMRCFGAILHVWLQAIKSSSSLLLSCHIRMFKRVYMAEIYRTE